MSEVTVRLVIDPPAAVELARRIGFNLAPPAPPVEAPTPLAADRVDAVLDALLAPESSGEFVAGAFMAAKLLAAHSSDPVAATEGVRAVYAALREGP